MARSILVKLGPPFSQAAGRKELTLELPERARSVADVVRALEQAYPALADEMRPDEDGLAAYSVFLNGTQIRRAELDSVLAQDGAEIRILMPIVGG
jgi:molybdopterin converting factor small subunit